MDKEELIKRHKEKVYLESADLVKRIQRVTTDHGHGNWHSFKRIS